VTIIVWGAVFLFAIMSIFAVVALQPLFSLFYHFSMKGEVGVA